MNNKSCGFITIVTNGLYRHCQLRVTVAYIRRYMSWWTVSEIDANVF